LDHEHLLVVVLASGVEAGDTSANQVFVGGLAHPIALLLGYLAKVQVPGGLLFLLSNTRHYVVGPFKLNGTIF
jgi:hypothetical protein